MNNLKSIVRQFWGVGIIFFYWILFSIPFFRNSFIPTHDGEFHIIRIFEFQKMIASGYLFPRWAPDMNSGYGLPLFMFHYPFPNYIGSFFSILGASFIDSFQFALITGYFVALLSCYFFIINRTKNINSTIITLLFATVPYWFVDINIRGSIGEVWGIAFILMAFAPIAWEKVWLIGISVCLLCLSHNIMAMLGVPIIFIFGFIHKRHISYTVFLGVLCASYFWLPALIESRFMIGLNTVTFSDHFPSFWQLIIPSWGSVFSQPGTPQQEVSQQIGIVPLIIFIASVYYIFFQKRKYTDDVLLFTIIALCSFLLMMPTSFRVWELIPPLQLLQYPWRLLSIIVVSMPLLSFYVIKNGSKLLIILIFILSLFFTNKYWRPVEYLPRYDSQYIENPQFTDGTSSMGNSFSTIWSPWKQSRPDTSLKILKGEVEVSSIQRYMMKDIATVHVKSTAVLEFHRAYFPGWTVFANDKMIPIDFEEGTIRFYLSEGTYSLRSVFQETPVRQLANSLSIIGIVSLLAVTYRVKYENRF